MRRTLVFCTVFLLIFSLAACGTQTPSQSTPTDGTTATTAATTVTTAQSTDATTAATEGTTEGTAAVTTTTVKETTVMTTADKWYGMTYKEDHQTVIDALGTMSDNGKYPSPLWNA